MSDYTYNPNTSLTDYAEHQDILKPKSINNPQFDLSNVSSTTLAELDQIELINRNTNEISKIKANDNQYPDILKKPLYTSVLPDGGLLVDPNTSNKRTKEYSQKANLDQENKAKTNTISNMTLKNFASNISNSLIEILNDILSFDWEKDNFIDIFTKENRLLALGVLFIIISVFLIFFKNTE